jgi:hypothetical protein
VRHERGEGDLYKDNRRRGCYEHTSFTFLGYTFAPRKAKGRDGGLYLGFLPAVSAAALKKMSTKLRRWRLHLWITRSLDELGDQINPVVGGWMPLLHRFYRSALLPLLERINTYLKRWAGRTYNDCRPTNASKRGGSGSSIETPTCSRTGAGPAPTPDRNGKSGVTGDCHAPFPWELGGAIPPGDPSTKLSTNSYRCLKVRQH